MQDGIIAQTTEITGIYVEQKTTTVKLHFLSYPHLTKISIDKCIGSIITPPSKRLFGVNLCKILMAIVTTTASWFFNVFNHSKINKVENIDKR